MANFGTPECARSRGEVWIMLYLLFLVRSFHAVRLSSGSQLESLGNLGTDEKAFLHHLIKSRFCNSLHFIVVCHGPKGTVSDEPFNRKPSAMHGSRECHSFDPIESFARLPRLESGSLLHASSRPWSSPASSCQAISPLSHPSILQSRTRESFSTSKKFISRWFKFSLCITIYHAAKQGKREGYSCPL
jgi:hypothetical protein